MNLRWIIWLCWFGRKIIILYSIIEGKYCYLGTSFFIMQYCKPSSSLAKFARLGATDLPILSLSPIYWRGWSTNYMHNNGGFITWTHNAISNENNECELQILPKL